MGHQFNPEHFQVGPPMPQQDSQEMNRMVKTVQDMQRQMQTLGSKFEQVQGLSKTLNSDFKDNYNDLTGQIEQMQLDLTEQITQVDKGLKSTKSV